MQNAYTTKVLKYFKNPKFVGEMKNADGIGEVGNPRCGDMMNVYIKVKNNKITDIRFKAYGCIAAISSTEALCKVAKGKTLEQAKKITSRDIVKELGGLPIIKLHCSVLGADGLKKAIQNYEQKHKIKAKPGKA